MGQENVRFEEYKVDGDAVVGQFAGGGASQTQQAGLGGGVVGAHHVAGERGD